MRVEPSRSEYHEAEHASTEFTKQELKNARLLLRRLRFLEDQVRKNGGISSGNGSGGAVFAELETTALEWILGPEGINFLADKVSTPR